MTTREKHEKLWREYLALSPFVNLTPEQHARAMSLSKQISRLESRAARDGVELNLRAAFQQPEVQ